MPKSRYRFNPESLSFDKVKLGFRDVLLRGLAYLIGSLLVAFVYYVIYASFFDSPKEKALLREIDQLTLQYDIIHREMENLDKVISQLEEKDDNLYRTIFEAEPIPETQRESGVGGINRYKDLEGYNNSSIVIETAKRLDYLKKKVVVQSKSYDELYVLAQNKEEFQNGHAGKSLGYGSQVKRAGRIELFLCGIAFHAIILLKHDLSLFGYQNGPVEAGGQEGAGIESTGSLVNMLIFVLVQGRRNGRIKA